MKNKFIVVEGLENAGKTTACNIIIDILNKYGIKREKILLTREPGGTPIAESLRTIITNQKQQEHITKITELLVIYAARAQLLDNVIKPALKCGKWVISDRHNLSSHAYQGGGRQLNSDLIDELSYIVLGDFYPDITFYLDITPDICLQRLKIQGNLDRIEQESLDFFERTRNFYLKKIQQNDNIIFIDATQSLDRVVQNLKKYLLNWLKNQ
ncbi:dTMP kinase [Candidatus Pantoea edessiphila]|uniref:Thymidylate kinase n=1 Tax=Candidatus Pantoea edessiphila TaxID=2044610 RepID=A0A2P5T166_9GAMM|nr:dTMP kinase [Candidatus Pantoea edessiphila]PPI88303.1 dTMP kinase [Candidatus Pantoea edessiphila]